MAFVLVLVGVPTACRVSDLPMVTARVGETAPDDVRVLPADCSIDDVMEALRTASASTTAVLYACHPTGHGKRCTGGWPMRRVPHDLLSSALQQRWSAVGAGPVHLLVDATLPPDTVEPHWPVVVDALSGMLFHSSSADGAPRGVPPVTLAYYRLPTECEKAICTRFREAHREDWADESLPPSRQTHAPQVLVCETLASGLQAARLVSQVGAGVVCSL